MLNLELLKSMDDQHAINALRADFDPLVNSPLEALLIDWLENLLDETADNKPINDVLDDHDLEAGDLKALGDALIEDTETTVALLGALNDANLVTVAELEQVIALDKILEDVGIDTPEELTRRLALAEQFRSIAADAGDVFIRLNQLTTTAQE